LLLCLSTTDRAASRTALAQDVPPMMKVDLIVFAGTDRDVCVELPAEATTVTVARRAYVPQNGTDRPFLMTIRPFASTAHALVENVSIREPLTLTFALLGGGTCFTFDNPLLTSEANVAQPYKAYAQVATIEVR
jgi:hypothetical protein